jgi:hypothetical protein
VLGIQPCTHPLPRRRECACPPRRPTARSACTATDRACPTGMPRNADTSYTVHRRSATTACGLPALRHRAHRLLATWSTPLGHRSRLPDLSPAPPVEKSPSQRYEPALHDRSRGEVRSGHRLGRRGLGVDVSAPLFAAVVTSADSADLHGPVNLAEGHSARDRPSATVRPVEVTPGGSDLSGRGRPTLTACRTPTRFSQSRGPHRPVNTRPLGMLR